jgi:hypothetical protein
MLLLHANAKLGLAGRLALVASGRGWFVAEAGRGRLRRLAGRPRLGRRRWWKRKLERPTFRGHLSAWSAQSGPARRMSAHAKGIELRKPYPRGSGVRPWRCIAEAAGR